MTNFLQVVGFDPLVVSAPAGTPGPAGQVGPAGPAGPAGPVGPQGHVSSGGTAAVRADISRDTAANWASANPIPGVQEQCFESDTGVLKIGDGVTRYASLNPVLSGTYALMTGDPHARAVRRALDSGRTFALGIQGDSTGANAGGPGLDLTAPFGATNDVHWFDRLGFKIAAKYPNYQVLTKHWNDANQDWDPWQIIQAAPGGQRLSTFSGSSMRWPTGGNSKFNSGNMDLRAQILPNSWTPATSGCIAARVTDGVAAWGTQFQFRFYLTTTGALQIIWSTDGATWGQSYTSTANLAGTAAGTILWVRATVSIVVGTSQTVNFYTSTDGTTWTQLGTTQTTNGATAALFQSTGHLEAGGYGLTTDGFAGSMYEVQLRDGVAGPPIAPCALDRWEYYADGKTTFGGAPTVYLINGSKSGSVMTYHTDATRQPKMLPDYGQLIQFFNDSKNEAGASGPLEWTTPYKNWVSGVQAKLPTAYAVACLQNPNTSAWTNYSTTNEPHVRRMNELSTLAPVSGWGVVDAWGAFLADPRGLTALTHTDGFHPATTTGMDLWAHTAAVMLGIPGA